MRSHPASSQGIGALVAAFWIGVDHVLDVSVERSIHAHFSEQHRPQIFGGVDQHLNRQSPFPRIALRFTKLPYIIPGVSQRSGQPLSGQRYGLIKRTIPRNKRHSYLK
jgi:hypothetical protein